MEDALGFGKPLQKKLDEEETIVYDRGDAVFIGPRSLNSMNRFANRNFE
uniref:Uncharacterized protein n=1 Tax=Eubacterium cellulosolvens (strain ATCC 43171 / JCM 9499 / 6) TaxID=633697 RepID=I5ARC7_EUBC6